MHHQVENCGFWYPATPKTVEKKLQAARLFRTTWVLARKTEGMSLCARIAARTGVPTVTTALSPGRFGNPQSGGSHETSHRFFGERCNATGVGKRGPSTGPAGAGRDAVAVHYVGTELLVGDRVGGGSGVVPSEEFSGVRAHRVSAGKHACRTSGRGKGPGPFPRQGLPENFVRSRDRANRGCSAAGKSDRGEGLQGGQAGRHQGQRARQARRRRVDDSAAVAVESADASGARA